ncbi:aspartate/glutamate racemase family protein [Dethiobacter alkaliphilus]|uniref:Aspartate racemase n=1 Tax=Dethiobacter alkaliphilus AHT 1 TaxID=555088 RepID=C0GKU7_DETAL|nr:aspartate/glutamate racemase family protein [Dethiobacter alkaliphilus]EEG76029.1 aspartate racemase [Dethiobacter alkaliphilus AHT 1]
MKTIGLIGGMSWESSLEYYRIINEGVKSRLGGLHSAQCILYSVEFAEIELYMRKGEWEKISQALIKVAGKLESAGADFILLCTNTMHKFAEEIQGAIDIELLHIAEATAVEVNRANIKKVGLLGTRPTMEQDFYTKTLQQNGIQVVIPSHTDREITHNVIFQELCLGIITPESKNEYKKIINGLIKQGAEGIILGCTEIPLLIKPEDSPVPLFDTTYIHAMQAVNKALAN